MATLKDLARNLGISAMAVSKALRDAPDISQATKTRVQEAARKFNYVPNRAAQNLRLKESGLLGVVIPNINHPYYSNLVWGIERQAESLGFQVLLGHSQNRGESEIEEVRKMLARQVQGILLVPAIRWQHRLATLELLRSANVPVVMLDRYPAGTEQFPRASWVVCKDRQGAEMATQYLLDMGHSEILFLAGPHGASSSAGRFIGYQRAMKNSPADFKDSRVFMGGSDIESGKAAMSQVLSEEVNFTAILAFNDHVALGAADVLYQQGFHVPNDVSVFGFGDGPLAAHYRVPLSTVRIPQIDQGVAAVHLLQDLIEGRPAVARELAVELVMRQSCGRPKSAIANKSKN